MASKTQRKASRRARKPDTRSTPAAVYELAERILAIRDRFEHESGKLRRLIADAEKAAKHPGAALGKQALQNLGFWRRELGNWEAHRARFEKQLVKDQALAVHDVDAIQPNGYFAPPPLTLHAVRDLRLKRAVEAVYGWLRYQAHKDSDDGMDRHPKYQQAFARAALEPASVLTALAPVLAPGRKLSTMKQLHALSQHSAVKERLESTTDGHKRAAEVLVALASGVGEQTVKRAAGS